VRLGNDTPEGEGGAVRKPYVAPEMKVLGAVDALTLFSF
jgi:hypothetical protein